MPDPAGFDTHPIIIGTEGITWIIFFNSLDAALADMKVQEWSD